MSNDYQDAWDGYRKALKSFYDMMERLKAVKDTAKMPLPNHQLIEKFLNDHHRKTIHEILQLLDRGTLHITREFNKDNIMFTTLQLDRPNDGLQVKSAVPHNLNFDEDTYHFSEMVSRLVQQVEENPSIQRSDEELSPEFDIDQIDPEDFEDYLDEDYDPEDPEDPLV